MKKIIIIDGGPRKNFNTASMLQQFAEGATSVGKEIEVKNYDRYELAGFPEEGKRLYRDTHWEQDLQRAYDAGRRMAENISKQ